MALEALANEIFHDISGGPEEMGNFVFSNFLHRVLTNFPIFVTKICAVKISTRLYKDV